MLSIQMRSAIGCVLLCDLVLLIVGVSVYAFHARGLYDNLDRTLVTSVEHAEAEITISLDNNPQLSKASDKLDVVLRLYDPNGNFYEATTLASNLPPPANPPKSLTAPAVPAYDVLASFAPPLTDLPAAVYEGAFGLLASNGQRWRTYFEPIRSGTTIVGYIEAITSLGRVDDSIKAIQELFWATGLFGMFIALGGSLLVSAQTLRPIGKMGRTAQLIALSHDFSQRIETPRRLDELGHLAVTFNNMLKSLEEAYCTQQRFIADASHELRAPLTAIQGNLELLHRQQNVMTATDKAEALTEASRETARLARLVSDLLVLARADAGVNLTRQSVSLDEVVLEIFNQARHLARGQRFVLKPFEPISIAGDEDRLKQLLLILLDNALKYTPPEGQVTLGLKRLDKAKEAQITVSDTGVGISATDLPHVFERFYQADPARSRDPGGTGLGLPIAKWITEQHGGRIEISSEPGKGTTIVVCLPLLV